MISCNIIPIVKHLAKFNIKLIPIIVFLVIATVTIEHPATIVMSQAHAKPTVFSKKILGWQDGTLMIELAPALCQISPSYSKYRQCAEKTAYVTKGFDVIGSDDEHKSSKNPKLHPLQSKVLNRYMPDKLAQNQAWRQYGASGQHSANQYFRQVIEFSSHITLPSDINLVNSSRVSRFSLIKQLKQNNIGLMENNVHLLCQPYRSKSILVRIDFCYQSGEFHQCDKDLDKKPTDNLKLCGDEINILGY